MAQSVGRRGEADHAKQECKRADGMRSVASAAKMSSLSLFSEAHAVAARHCRQEARLTCRSICTDYCNKTAVHGFRYFFDARLAVVERVFWVLAVFLSIGGCFYLISKIWSKWELCPVMVTFSETPTPIWDVPFPAVTICPATKTKQDLFNFTLALHKVMDNNITDEELWRYQALSLICFPEILQENPSFNESAVHFLREVAPTFNEVVVECFWQFKELLNCSQYFQEVLTSNGVCYSFNALGVQELFNPETVQAMTAAPSLPSSGWNTETGYDDVPGPAGYFPLRQMGLGPYSGLRLILRSYERDMDYVCRGCEQAFRVMLHSPGQMASGTAHQLVLPLNASIHVLARPSLMTTSPGLREYGPRRRTCYFPYERHLRFYRIYSQPNCVSECFSNITLHKCGCTPFFSPRLPSTRVCSYASKCIMATYDHLLNDWQDGMFGGAASLMPEECDCLPSCYALHYDGEASVAHYPWIKEKEARRQVATEQGVSLSQLNVYFSAIQFISSRRSELYGHTDFLANCGGLLGLFSGFSVISLVEVVYYLSLRLWCEIRRRAAEKHRRQ